MYLLPSAESTSLLVFLSLLVFFVLTPKRFLAMSNLWIGLVYQGERVTSTFS